MSVQPKRRNSGQRKRRASHFALKKTNLAVCADCGKKARPHRACPACGAYLKVKQAQSKEKSPTKK